MAELNASATNWLSDLEMDGYDLFPQCPLSLLDDDDNDFLSPDIVSALKGKDDNYLESLQQTLSSADETGFEIPVTSTITEHVSPVLSPSSSDPSSPTSPKILSFDNTATIFYGFHGNTLSPKPNDAVSVLSPPRPGNINFSAQAQAQARKGPSENQNIETRKGTKRPRESQDHIMAERKRREKLSQSLIALAALIPGLKKMDKASVLGDAIKYVKELQERLRVLEEQSNKRSEVESVVIVNSDDDSSSCDDESFEAASGGAEALPHVEARVAEKEVLLRIHCQKHKGIYVKLLAEIQRLHLSVVNSSALPFGDSVLDITIVAQMGTDYKLTIRDLVRNLRVATLRSMS